MTAGGKYSSKLSCMRLRQDYEEIRDDPRLIFVTEEIALLDARVGQLLERLPEQFSPTFAKDAFNLFLKMQKGGEKGVQAMMELGELLRQGANESQSWIEIVKIVSERRRLARTQQVHVERMQKYLAVQQVVALFTRMTELVLRHVEDPRTRTILADGFDRIAEGAFVDAPLPKALPPGPVVSEEG